MKKFYYFLCICLWILSFGSFCQLLFIKEYFMAISSIIMTIMAFPYVKQCANKLNIKD